MADKIDKNTWGKPPDSSKNQERRERNHSIRSNLLTILIAGIIIASGFILPSQLYPYIDSYRGQTVHLAHPSDSTLAGHVFEEPIVLYPWNLYDEQRLRPLSSSEEELIIGQGIPDFLLATLRDHGWQTEDDLTDYQERIAASFRYLEPPEDSDEAGCFVLMSADIDADGRADFNCAVDQLGNIISLLFLAERWDTVQLEAPIGLSVAAPLEENVTENNTDTPGDGTTPPAGDNQEETGTPTPGAAQNASATNGTETNRYDTSYLPIDEDDNLWAFAYATSREAYAIDQQELYFAFRQLELNYENRYGYPYFALLPLQSEEIEILPGVGYTALTPLPYTNGDSLLYIYDLSNGERLILYLDPNTMHCRGFNLLWY